MLMPIASPALAPVAIIGYHIDALHTESTVGGPALSVAGQESGVQDGKQAVIRGAGREIGGEARASSMLIPLEKCPN